MVCGIHLPVVAQREEDVRRAGEACADAPVVALRQRGEVRGGFFPNLLRGEHIQVDGQDVSGLELLQQLAVAVRKNRAVRIRRLFGQCPVVLRVLLFAQNVRDFRQQRACVAQRRRACPLDAPLPLAHLRHVRRNPVTEAQRAGHFPEITVLAETETAPEAAGVDVLLHRRIHPAQHVHIALRHVFRPRHEDTRIAPPRDRHFRHRRGEAVALHRHRVRQTARRQLLRLHVQKPLVQEAVHVEIEHRRRRKHGNITRPAHALVALRAVGGNIHEVRLRTADDVLLQAVEHLVRAAERTRLLNVGVQHDARHLHVLFPHALDADVAEAHVRQPRRPRLTTFLADVRRCRFRRAQERRVQRTVRVQHFAVADGNLLPAFARDRQAHDTREILPEVVNQRIAQLLAGYGSERLVFLHIRAVIRHQLRLHAQTLLHGAPPSRLVQ